jgi:hypothetical protein
MRLTPLGSKRIGELAARCDRAAASFIQAQPAELHAAPLGSSKIVPSTSTG